MAAPSSPVAQNYGGVWDPSATNMLGPLAVDRFATFYTNGHSDSFEFHLWEISAGEVTQIGFTNGAYVVSASNVKSAAAGGIIAVQIDYGWFIILAASPWTVSFVGFDFETWTGNTGNIYIAGDLSEAVASTLDGTVYGLPVDGVYPGVANWSCSLGSGRLVGAPHANRWLRENDAGGVDLVSSGGSVLDSLAWDWTAVPGNGYDGGRDNTAWVQVSEDVTTYVYSSPVDSGASSPILHYRSIITTGDTIDWDAAEATCATTWPDQATTRSYPVASAWDGQIAVSYRQYWWWV